MSRLTMATVFSPGMSFAVSNTTREKSNSGAKTSALSLPWASGERTAPPNHAPSGRRSARKRVAPVTLSAASTRATGRPL